MSKAVVALTASTIGLAATTVYFAWQLGELRNAPLAAPVIEPSATAATPVGARQPSSGTARIPAATTGKSAPAFASNDPRARRAENLAKYGDVSRDFMASYDDPEKRARLLKDETNMRREQLRSMRGQVELTEEQWDAAIGLQAAESLDFRARSTRCFLDEKCDEPEPAPRSLEERRDALIEQIGRTKFDALQARQKHGAETSMVDKLQERLPADQRLKPVEVEALLDVLGEEVQSVMADLRSRGIQTGIFSSWSTVPYARELATLDAQLAVAREGTDRLRTRAATLLRGDRYDTFNIMLDDGLLMFRSFARREISLRKLGPAP